MYWNFRWSVIKNSHLLKSVISYFRFKLHDWCMISFSLGDSLKCVKKCSFSSTQNPFLTLFVNKEWVIRIYIYKLKRIRDPMSIQKWTVEMEGLKRVSAFVAIFQLFLHVKSGKPNISCKAGLEYYNNGACMGCMCTGGHGLNVTQVSRTRYQKHKTDKQKYVWLRDKTTENNTHSTIQSGLPAYSIWRSNKGLNLLI